MDTYKLKIIRPYLNPVIYIETNSLFLYNQLLLMYMNNNLTLPTGKNILNIQISKEKYYYIISVDKHKPYIVEDALSEISSLIIFYRKPIQNYVLLHCAAIAKDNKALLFIGPTHSGKTTLTTYLINNGYNYISDDYVAISSNNLNVQPNGNPIHLRLNGMEILTDQCKNMVLSGKYIGNHDKRFILVPKNIIDKAIEIKSIYFSSYSNSAILQLIKSKQIIMKKIIDNHLLPPELTLTYLHLLYRFTEYPTYELRYTTVTQAKELIENNGV